VQTGNQEKKNKREEKNVTYLAVEERVAEKRARERLWELNLIA